MKTAAEKPSRLMREMVELATAMRSNGTMDDGAFAKITLRTLKEAEPIAETLGGDDIRALREAAHMSQAVFARCLNLTAGYVSQLERGVRTPSGAALVLLNVIRRKGIDVIL